MSSRVSVVRSRSSRFRRSWECTDAEQSSRALLKARYSTQTSRCHLTLSNRMSRTMACMVMGMPAPFHDFDLSSHAPGHRLDDILIVNPGKTATQTVRSLSASYIRETEEQWVQRDFR